MKWEKIKEKEQMREKEKFDNLEKKKESLIQADLEYDTDEEDKRKRRNPKEYKRYFEERKKVRDREVVEDEKDVQLESKELEELQKKKL